MQLASRLGGERALGELWRFDLDVLAGQVEELTVGRLHRDPVTAIHSRAEAHLGTREPLWSPPLRDLLRIGHRVEHALPGGLEDRGEIVFTWVATGAMEVAPSMQLSDQLGSYSLGCGTLQSILGLAPT